MTPFGSAAPIPSTNSTCVSVTYHSITEVQIMLCLWPLTDLHSKMLDVCPRSNFLHSHAVFGNFFRNNRLALSPFRLTPSRWEILDQPLVTSFWAPYSFLFETLTVCPERPYMKKLKWINGNSIMDSHSLDWLLLNVPQRATFGLGSWFYVVSVTSYWDPYFIVSMTLIEVHTIFHWYFN